MPSGGPVFSSLAIPDVDIPPWSVSRHIVVAISCDPSVPWVYMKAVPSSRIRDHRAVFAISEVVDPGCWSIGSRNDIFFVVFREVSVLQINHQKVGLMHESINSYRVRCEIFSENRKFVIIACTFRFIIRSILLFLRGIYILKNCLLESPSLQLLYSIYASSHHRTPNPSHGWLLRP